METTFTAELFEWRGSAPYYWLALPPEVADEVKTDSSGTAYG